MANSALLTDGALATLRTPPLNGEAHPVSWTERARALAGYVFAELRKQAKS